MRDRFLPSNNHPRHLLSRHVGGWQYFSRLMGHFCSDPPGLNNMGQQVPTVILIHKNLWDFRMIATQPHIIFTEWFWAWLSSKKKQAWVLLTILRMQIFIDGCKCRRYKGTTPLHPCWCSDNKKKGKLEED